MKNTERMSTLQLATIAKLPAVTSKRKRRHDNNKTTDINEKKVNHFDRRPKTYRPYCKQTTSKPTLIADSSVFFIFPTAHFF